MPDAPTAGEGDRGDAGGTGPASPREYARHGHRTLNAETLGPLGPLGFARRAHTVSRKQLAREVARAAPEPVPAEQRPYWRADCVDGPRPCPWVSCKWNLYLDTTKAGSITLNFPGLDVDEVPNNCALDVADLGGVTLEQVGQVMNVTRERVRQVTEDALAKMRKAKVLK